MSDAGGQNHRPLKMTGYFRRVIRRKRIESDPALCRQVLNNPIRREVQPDGRIRFWGEVTIPGFGAPRILRVVTLEDGETVHNAFLDRGFRR